MEIFPSESHKRKLLATLKVLGVKKIEAAFSGGGDSGDFDAPVAYDHSDRPIDLTTVKLSWLNERSTWDEHSGFTDNSSDNSDTPVQTILRQMFADIVELTDLDWYNNDGGSGTVTINFAVSPPDVSVEMSTYYTASEDHSFDFSDRLHLNEDRL
jgi:hypothetical protein